MTDTGDLRTILIVEDESALRELYACVLERHGWRAFTAATEEEALGVFAREAPAVVLSDFNLPQGDGISIIKKVKSSAPNAGAILLSGYLTPELVDRALRNGAFDCLRKPVTLNRIVTTVEQAFEWAHAAPDRALAQSESEEDSRRKLRSLVASTPHCAVVINANYRIVAANDFCLQRFDAQAVGKRCYEVFGASGRFCSGCRAVAALESTHPYVMARPAPGPNDGLTMVSEHVEACHVIPDEPHVLVTLMDVPEVHSLGKSTATARPPEVEQATIGPGEVERQHLFLVITDFDGAILYANDCFEQTILDSRNKAQGRTFFDVCEPWLLSTLQKSQLDYRNWVAQNPNAELSMVLPEGGTLLTYWEFVIPALHPGEGHDVVIAIGSSTESFRTLQGLIRFYNACHRELFQGQFDMVVTCDASMKILGANDRFRQSVGAKRRDIVGHLLGDFLASSEDVARLQSALATIRGSGLARNLRLHLQTGSGATLPTRVNIMEVSDAYNVTEGYALVLRDLQEEEKFERMLHHSEKMHVLGELCAGVVHQLNNYIQSVMSWAEHLKIDPGLRDGPDKILASATRMQQLSTDILQFARRDDGADTEPAHIQTILESLVALTRWRMKRDGITVETCIEPGLPLVRGSSAKIEQVILNVLINAADAIRASDREECDRKIRLTASVAGERVRVDIEDSGTGIPAGVQKFIFANFFTTKEFGTGLGLSLAESIVTSLGGRIELARSGPEGSQFRIEIPVESEPKERGEETHV